ncbi:MAG: hypothetical protein GX587_03080 [Bacteroidales bacterium]|nr:hypothetical protein [Bacteroidales bacterium]
MKRLLITLFTTVFVLSLFSCKDEIEDEDEKENENDTVIVVTPMDKVITSIAIHGNDIWVGTNMYGLFKKDGDSWINYTDTSGLPSNEITSIAIGDDGVVWVGFLDHGILKIAGDEWTRYTSNDGLASSVVYSFAFDNDGNLIAGTGRNGIAFYNGQSFSSIQIDDSPGHIHSITVDLEGNIWTGGCYTGLSMYDGQNWTLEINECKKFVMAVYAAQNGDIWAGDLDGTYRLHDGAWTECGLGKNTASSFVEDLDHNIWIGGKGLYKFNGSEFETIDSVNYYSSLVCDPEGKIWAGGTGITVFEP